MEEKKRKRRARDRPIHEEDEGIGYVRVKLVWKDVTRVHARTHACILSRTIVHLENSFGARTNILQGSLIIEGSFSRKFIPDS